MIANAVLIFLFSIGGIASIVHGSFGLGMAELLIAAIGIIVWRVGEKTKVEHNEFLSWLLAHYDEIKQGTARYKERPIRSDTMLSQYLFCASALFLTSKSPSSMILPGTGLSRITAAAYTLGSLLLGWWGLPWGPIYTIQVVVNNLRGGSKTSVATILDAIETAKNKEALENLE